MTDAGGIVLGWLGRVAVSLALLGLLGVDAVSIASTWFQAADLAGTAAGAAATSYRAAPDAQRSYEAALATVAGSHDTIDPRAFSVGPDGTVRLTVGATAKTLWVRRIGPLAHLARVRSSARAGAAS